MQHSARQMRPFFFLLWTVFLLTGCLEEQEQTAPTIPGAPTGYVTDAAGALAASEIKAVNRLLRNHEQATTNQIFVLLAPTTGNRDPAMLTTETAEKWGVGQQGKDNGVLVALYMKDRYLQISVGYGLEARITDLETARIREEIMNPRLQRGDAYEAVYAGASALIRAANGESMSAASKDETTRAHDKPATIKKPSEEKQRPSETALDRYFNNSEVGDDGVFAVAFGFGTFALIVAYVFFLEITRQIGFRFASAFSSRRKRAVPVLIFFFIILSAGSRLLFLICKTPGYSAAIDVLFGFGIATMLLCWAVIYPALLMGQAKYLKKRAKMRELKRIDPFQHGAKYFFALLIWGASALFFAGGLFSYLRLTEDYFTNLIILAAICGALSIAGWLITFIPDRRGVEISRRGSSQFNSSGGGWYNGGASSWSGGGGGFSGGGGGFSGGGGGSFGGGGSGGSW